MKFILISIAVILTFNGFVIGYFALNKFNQHEHGSSQLEITASQVDTETKYNIDDYFTIQTLEEVYGESLFEMVELDSTIISYDDLRYLSVLHVGFDGTIKQGELIVNAVVAEEVLSIFREIYDIGFPIEKMHVITHYHNSDEASMLDNNTSAFNFRTIAQSTELSNHAYGLAIDINPMVNPYVKANITLPSNAHPYVDRAQDVVGMINANDDVVKIFKKYGWSWGGDWDSIKDYQHFEKEI